MTVNELIKQLQDMQFEDRTKEICFFVHEDLTVTQIGVVDEDGTERAEILLQ